MLCRLSACRPDRANVFKDKTTDKKGKKEYPLYSQTDWVSDYANEPV